MTCINGIKGFESKGTEGTKSSKTKILGNMVPRLIQKIIRIKTCKAEMD